LAGQQTNWVGWRVIEMERERTAGLGEKTLSAEGVRQLYDLHGPALVAYACSFVGDSAAAEDVVHQVFLRLLSLEIRMPAVPVAYVYRAVRNAALNVRRNGLRTVQLDPRSSVFEHRGADVEAAMALQKALGELPEEQREVVVMRVWSGLTLEEVAAATDVPLNTVASRYRYALEKLQEKLQPHKRNEKGTMENGK